MFKFLSCLSLIVRYFHVRAVINCGIYWLTCMYQTPFVQVLKGTCKMMLRVSTLSTLPKVILMHARNCDVLRCTFQYLCNACCALIGILCYLYHTVIICCLVLIEICMFVEIAFFSFVCRLCEVLGSGFVFSCKLFVASVSTFRVAFSLIFKAHKKFELMSCYLVPLM